WLPTPPNIDTSAGSSDRTSLLRNSITASNRPSEIIGKANAPQSPDSDAADARAERGSVARFEIQIGAKLCQTSPGSPTPRRKLLVPAANSNRPVLLPPTLHDSRQRSASPSALGVRK